MIVSIYIGATFAVALAKGTANNGVPPLDQLASTWQTVRVCNMHANLQPCHGKNNLWATEKACIDAGCCWGGNSCFAPNDQRPSNDPGVARFAANQQAPSLSNGVGMLMVVKSGDPLGISCITAPPYAGECQTSDTFGSLSITSDRTTTPLLLKDASIDQNFQWFPHQILRSSRAAVQGQFDVSVNTTTRMPFQRRSVLLEATVQFTTNPSSGSTPNFQVSVNLLPAISNFAKGVVWGWTVPRPRSMIMMIISC